MRFAVIWLAALVLALSPSHAQQMNSRIVANDVAALIETNFYNEARAEAISGELRAASAAGTWDSISDPRELATALTNFLTPHDRHFDVSWSPRSRDSETVVSRDQRGQLLYGIEDAVRRSGFGFREVKILPGNIGYIDMASFANIDFNNVDDPALRSAKGALDLVSHTDATIIDLRDNFGGSPWMVGYLISAFTEPGALVHSIYQSRSGREDRMPVVPYPAPRVDVPLYILISARTRPAPEALAYSLQAVGRATIIGEPSSGAANPGGVFDAGSGFEVFISIGSTINPITGTNWEGVGVLPDVATSADDALRRGQILALDAALESGNAVYQLDWAWARSALDERSVPEMDLSDFEGIYGRLVVILSETGLEVQVGSRPARALVPIDNDLFYSAENPLRRYRFIRDDNGRIEKLEISHSDGTFTSIDRRREDLARQP
ncbi:S41 family peptidase [uncultured Parasphingopyxis sp.]|uniref:S41 family peptidase n=1 Tax=uncultured Parasphingopyxis sp. TaxID=1547918 RepID=UPI00262828B9|nr:S41 family peptidase [uncultured Parasphingopyxis sp.]